MRILYMTNGFPFPLTSGYLRHYYLIRALAAQHAVTLLSVVGGTFVEAHREALAPFTERVLTFLLAEKGRSAKHKLLSRAQAVAAGSRAGGYGEMQAAVRQLTQAERFDLVLFSGKGGYEAIDGLAEPAMVVDICDATSMRLRGRMRYSSRLYLPWLALQYAQVRRVEHSLVRRAAHLLFASTRDRAALLGPAANGRATVIPNGVDTDYWRRSSPQLGANTIVFTGAMHYAPNADAALYLIRKIFPLVQRRVPDARLLIVGRDPGPTLQQAGRQPGVTVTGYVDDVRVYLEQASVFACPLRYGAGIQNKVLEAMAMAVPVVASPLAAEGLRLEDGEAAPIEVSGPGEAFVEALLRRLCGAARPLAPDTQARAFVAEHFVWQRSGEKLEQVLGQFAGN